MNAGEDSLDGGGGFINLFEIKRRTQIIGHIFSSE
jgi:hypothetical protein